MPLKLIAYTDNFYGNNVTSLVYGLRGRNSSPSQKHRVTKACLKGYGGSRVSHLGSFDSAIKLCLRIKGQNIND